MLPSRRTDLSPARSAPLAPPSRQRFEPTYEQHRALQLRWLHVDQQLSHAQIAEHVGVDVRTVRSWFSSPVFCRWWNGRLRKLVQSLDGPVALRLARAALNPAAEDRAAARASHWFLAHFGPRARTERKPKQDGGLAALIAQMQPGDEVVLAARRSPHAVGSGQHDDAVQLPRQGEGCSEITARGDGDQSVASLDADPSGGRGGSSDELRTGGQQDDPDDVEFEDDEQEDEQDEAPREPGGTRPPRIRDG